VGKGKMNGKHSLSLSQSLDEAAMAELVEALVRFIITGSACFNDQKKQAKPAKIDTA
jgi:hypothetical protein